MNLAGINDGDLVLCRKDYHPVEGNKVVALIGDDATIKELRYENGAVVLNPKSNNPKHKPLIFTENDEIVRFFNPRKDKWNDHFNLVDGIIHCKTDIAKATQSIFQFNELDRLIFRRQLILQNQYTILS